jgi:Arc/MetJ-type ribon-helix-helix transcriptional regulator
MESTSMAHHKRLSISIDARHAAKIRKLVATGDFKNVSAAFEEAATMLIEQQAERKAWWAETISRCDHADKRPEQMIEAGAFFDAVRADILAMAKSSRFKK